MSIRQKHREGDTVRTDVVSHIHAPLQDAPIVSDRHGTRKVLPLGQLEDNAQYMGGLDGRHDPAVMHPWGVVIAEQIRKVAPGGWQSVSS